MEGLPSRLAVLVVPQVVVLALLVGLMVLLVVIVLPEEGNLSIRENLQRT